MSYSDWFRRLTSQGGTGRKRARRSLLFTGIAAALVVVAGVAVLVAKPGQAPLKTTSVASSHQETGTGSSKPAKKHTVPPAPALTITSVVPYPSNMSEAWTRVRLDWWMLEYVQGSDARPKVAAALLLLMLSATTVTGVLALRRPRRDEERQVLAAL